MASGEKLAIHVGEKSIKNEKMIVNLWGFVIISVRQHFGNRKSESQNK